MVAVAGEFAEKGAGRTFGASRPFNLSLKVGAGSTLELERYVGGDWRSITAYTAGVETVITPAGSGVVLYRVNCTTFAAASEYLMAYDEDLNTLAAIGVSDSLEALITENGYELVTEAGVPIRLED